MMVTAIAAPAASAAPWVCDNAGYVVQEDPQTTNDQTWFQRVDRQPNGTYTLSRLGTLPNTSTLNALGFRPQDGFMYAWNLDNDNIVQIERNPTTGQAVFDPLGVPAGMPPGFSTVVGTFLETGRYFVWGSVPGVGQRGLIIDVTTSPTPTVVGIVTPNYNTDVWSFADFAVNPADGELYTMLVNTTTGAGEVRQLVLAGGELSIGRKVADTAGSAGAQWFSPAGANGTMIAYEGNVRLVSIDIATGQRTIIGDPPDVANVDGTACANGISLTKDAVPRTVTAGTELTYTYRVVSRALAAAPLSFVDQLPAGLTYVPGSVTIAPAFGTPNDYGGTDTLSVSGTIGRQQTVTITARVRVAPNHACNANVDNQAQSTLRVAGLPPVTVDSDDPDTPANPEDATRVRVVCSADVRIVKSASTSPIVPGTEATFALVATNDGPSTAANVRVSDPLPAGFSFRSASEGCTEAGGTLTCTVASLAPGTSQTFTVTGQTASDLVGCMENTGTVASDTPDPAAANNTSTICAPIEPRADMSITKTASTSPIVPGENAIFTFVATNNGPSTATSVVVSDALPAAFSFRTASEGCSEAGGTLTCTVASLAPGASQTFTVTGRVASDLDECLENTGTVSSGALDPNPDNNTSTICTPIEGSSDISITKTASTATVPSGGQVMYTLVVRNDGPSDDPNVEVSDALAAGLTLVAAEPSQGSCTTANNTVSCDLGRLKDSGSAQVLVTVNTSGPGGCIPNTARVRGAHEDPDGEDNEASAQVCVEPPPVDPTTFDLEVDKRVNVSRPRVGQRVTYRIVVSNNGPDAAPDARVTDTFNSRATVVSVETPQGSCTRRLPVTCELGRIDAGASVTITMVIKPRETGRARNAASATSCCGTDTTPGNNMDTADIRVGPVALRVSKLASDGTVVAGQTFSYRIRVRNPTRGEARRVRVCDRLPSGLTYRSSAPRARRSGRQWCWRISRLGARASRTYRVTVRAARGATGRTVNRATAGSPDARTATARAPVRVLGRPTPVTG